MNSTEYKLIQKRPRYKIINPSSPLYCNHKPVYIEKYDRPVNPKPNSRFEWIHNSGKDALRHISIICSGDTRFLVPTELGNGIQLIKEENIIKMHQALPEKSRKYKDGLEDFIEDVEHIETTPMEIKTLFNGKDLLEMDTSTEVALLDPILPLHEISFLAAKGDTGKSLFAQQILLSIVLNCPICFGMKLNAEFNSTLFITTEEHIRRIAERVQKQVSALKEGEVNIDRFYTRTVKEDQFGFLNRFLAHKKVDLVVLDPFGEVMEGEENMQKDVREYMYQVELLIKKYNCTVLFLGHLRKTAGNNPTRLDIVGSTAIGDRARNVLIMTKDKKTGVRTIKIDKSNNLGEEIKNKPIKLNFDPVSLTYSLAAPYDTSIVDADSPSPCILKAEKEDQAAKEIAIPKQKKKPGRKIDPNLMAKAKQMASEGISQVDIAKTLGESPSNICRWLKT